MKRQLFESTGLSIYILCVCVRFDSIQSYPVDVFRSGVRNTVWFYNKYTVIQHKVNVKALKMYEHETINAE